MKNQHSSVRI